MNIAIDLDETLFSCKSVVYKVLTKVQTPSNINKKLKYKPVTKQNDVNVGWLKFLCGFFNPDKYVEKANAISTINKLSAEGHKIIFLSSRPNQIKTLKQIALKWLNDNKVNYDALIFGCQNKAAFCDLFKIDVLIDDKLKSCVNSTKFNVDAINLDEKKVGTISEKQQNKANKIINSHIDNKLLHFAGSWNAVYFLTQIINLNRSKHPINKELLKQELDNKFFALANTPVMPSFDRQLFHDFLVRYKIANDYVIKNPSLVQNLKFENLQNYIQKHTPTKK